MLAIGERDENFDINGVKEYCRVDDWDA